MRPAALGGTAVIAACVAIPLLLAALSRWLPRHPVIMQAGAGLTLVTCLALPWTGSSLAPWLAPDPLGIHLAALAAFAWLAASLLGPDDMPPDVPASIAGCLILAALTDQPDLTVLAAGVAVHAAVLAQPARPPGLLPMASCSLGVAVFGVALLHGLAPSGWSALPEAASHVRGVALGLAAMLTLLGLGAACLLGPLAAAVSDRAAPRSLAVLAGPVGGMWLLVALRMRGVLDGNIHAIAPGAWLLTAGAALMLAGSASLLRRPGLLPGATLALFGAAVFGIGLGGAAGTAAALLHLTLGCLALAAAQAGGRPGVLGLAALAGLPPLGVFASAYGLFAASAASGAAPALVFAALELALVLAALRRLPAPEGAASPAGWAALVLALGAGWALPPTLSAWLLGIAAAAR